MILAATPGMPSSKGLAYAAAGVVLAVYAIGLITSFWLPEPTPEMQVD
jgi:hypothetical protein